MCLTAVNVLKHAPCLHEVYLIYYDYWSHMLCFRYGESIILLLPQLECSLRILYCVVNDLPDRIITAEQDTLYLTFDEMVLRPKKLVDLLPSNIIEMLLDLLIHPEGPRIRDRIGHAEVRLFDVPKGICTLCWVISFCVMAVGSHQELPLDICAFINGYQSHFHPISLWRKELVEMDLLVTEWFQTSSSMEGWGKEFCSMLQLFCFSFDDMSQPVKNVLDEVTLRTLYRPKAEMSMVKCLRKINVLGLDAIRKTEEGLAFAEQQLSSTSVKIRKLRNILQRDRSLPIIIKFLKLASLLQVHLMIEAQKYSVSTHQLKYVEIHIR